MVDRQIMSDPNVSVPVEQAVTKKVAKDQTGALLSTLLTSGIKAYSTYLSENLRNRKTEALGKAWEIAQKVKQARESGQITPLEAKSNLNKALTGLTAQYGLDVQSAVSETMARAFKWNDSLKGTEVDKIAQNLIAAGKPKSEAYAIASQVYSLELNNKMENALRNIDPRYAAKQEFVKKVAETALNLNVPEQEAVKLVVAQNRLAKKTQQLKDEVEAMENQSKINASQLSSVNAKASTIAIGSVYLNIVKPLLMRDTPPTEEEKQNALAKANKMYSAAKTEILTRINKYASEGKITPEEANRQIQYTQKLFDTYNKSIEGIVTTGDISKAKFEETKTSIMIDLSEKNPEIFRIAVAFPSAFNGLMSQVIKIGEVPNEKTRQALYQNLLNSARALSAIMEGNSHGGVPPEGFKEVLSSLNSPDVDEETKGSLANNVIGRLKDASFEERQDLLSAVFSDQKTFNTLYKYKPEELSSLINSSIDSFIRRNKELDIKAKDITYEIKDGIPVIYLIPKDSMNNPMIFHLTGTKKVPLAKEDPLYKAFFMLYRKSNAEGKPFEDVFNLYKKKLLEVNK